MNLQGKSCLTLLDYSEEEIIYLLDVAEKLKKEKKSNTHKQTHVGKNIVLVFQKDSTRTRCAFEVAAMDLGIGVTCFGPSGTQVYKKESLSDTAEVLGRMYDGIEFRGYKQSDVELLRDVSKVPVWNGLTDKFHPTQILADLLTVREKKHRLKGLRCAFVGDAKNNVANSLMVGCAKLGIHFTALAPEEFWPTKELRLECQEIAEKQGSSLKVTQDIDMGLRDVDLVYTDVWVSMGESKKVWRERLEKLVPYQVNKSLLEKAKPEALFLHCLPAFHNKDTEVAREIVAEFGKDFTQIAEGELEVSNEVFYSPNSVVFDQAENRMHITKALIYTSLGETNK